MKEKKLQVKDFVLIGVFAVIYMAVMMVVGMMGMIPILFLVYPSVLGLVAGIIVMLMMAKVPKPGALFIFTILTPLIMFAMGHTYIVLVGGIIVGLLAELIRYSGRYASMKTEVAACAVMNLWAPCSILQMLLAKEKYMALTLSMMPENYAGALERLVTWPNMLLVFAGALVGGFFGALIGKKLLYKHFKKAGIA
ncbi:MAG: MptD family putative ECF transporter S component [Eubacteriales bacterium]|nr:MptD family putative ECF transporter S component [Eubacteriales bacterium]